MSRTENMKKALLLVIWGYILIHVNINVGPINILPDFLGYVLFYMALPLLAEEAPSAKLLRPLALIIAAWELVIWCGILPIFGQTAVIFRTLDSALSLYFHFQLLTNLAEIAQKLEYPGYRRLLTLRTVKTLLITFFALPLDWDELFYGSMALVMVSVVVAVWICAVLISFRGYVSNLENKNSGQSPGFYCLENWTKKMYNYYLS